MGIGNDKIKSFSYYRISAEKGHIIAQIIFGYLVDEKGRNGTVGMAEDANKIAPFQFAEYHTFRKDEINAFEYYKRSAEKGHNMAQNNLGHLYGHGVGTKRI